MELSVVIPCLNEEKAISQVLGDLTNVKKGLEELPWMRRVNIILVDDGSTDRSVELAQGFDVEIIRHPQRRGYGAAIKSGIAASESELIAMMDMDCTYSPFDLEALVCELYENQLDSVVGNRFSQLNQMPWIRKVGNLFYRFCIQLLYLYPIRDACSGMRVFRRSSWQRYSNYLPDGLNFALVFSLLMIQTKAPWREIDIRYGERAGDSKLSVVSDGFLFLKDILRFRLFRLRA